MTLRTKINLSIGLAMVVITIILTWSLAYHTVSQYKRHKESFDASLNQVVENWVSTALPESLGTNDLVAQLDRYESKFFVEGTPSRENGLFDQIVLIDRYRRVVRVIGNQGEIEVGKKLYDPALIEAMNSGLTKTDGRTVYRPLTRQVTFQSQGETRTETLWVMKMGLRLKLPEPAGTEDLITYVLLVMVGGTVVLLVSMLLLLSRVVLKPLEQLAGISHSIASGDFSRHMPTPTSADEIGTLIRAFDGMRREVQNHRQSLKQQVEDAIRQQRKAEQGLIIAQRLAATGTLAAGIAHEINNPLMGMQSATQRLKKKYGEKLDAKGHDYIDLINEGLQRIQDIVKQVLDVSRRHVNPKPFDIAEPVQKAVAFVEHKAKRYDVKLNIEPPPDDPSKGPIPLCFGDRGEINQVLTNLLINAIDAIRDARDQDRQADIHAPERPGIVTVKWEAVTEGIRTAVSDTGIGMSAEHASRAFDAFYTTKQDGTGLGLAIIHSIIDSHGGSIEIESEPGNGTTVIFTIPKHLEV